MTHGNRKPEATRRGRAGSTKLSSAVTVAQYFDLEQAGDRKRLAGFIQERFAERYFQPLEQSRTKHGFMVMAVACLVIETLESFYQGLADTRSKSKKMFSSFFERETALKILGGEDDWFYRDIRCGIHQGETRRGWRVRRDGPLLDRSAKTINATRIMRELRKAVAKCGEDLQADETTWQQFRKKMNAVCANCDG